MKLGLSIGYSGAHLDVPVALVQRAEELGYDLVWSAEAYGSDAITPLAFLAAMTKRIKLGTGIMQLAHGRRPMPPFRPPALTRWPVAAASSRNSVLGPQIVEGWYGQPSGEPFYRVKDYVAIMRKIFKREGPVTHEGREISLPYKGEGSAGLAKPLKSILHMNPDIPIYLATGGEAMVELTAEIADGWLPMGFVPGAMEEYGPWLEEGLPPCRQRQELEGFHHPGLRSCRGRQRRERGADAPQAGSSALCGRHGSPDQEFSQRHHGPARLRRRRQADPGTLPRRPQGRSHRHGPRRVGRSEIFRRPTGAYPRTLPRLGGQWRGFAQRAIGPARGHRGDGQGRAAELRRERHASTPSHRHRLRFPQHAGIRHGHAEPVRRDHRPGASCSIASASISCGSPSTTSSMTATCPHGCRWRARSPRVPGHVRLSSNVCLLPFDHPVRLAEDLAVLDNIGDGRIEVGVGMGYAPHEFRGFGLPVSRRVSLTDEGIEVLRHCFTGEKFSFHGKRYDFDDVAIRPRYVQPGGPPLWIAAMSEPGAQRAARHDSNFLPQGARSMVLDPWRTTLKASGRNPDSYRVGIIRSCLVTDDAERD